MMTALHPRLISGAEPYIRDLSARLLAPMLERGSGDLVAEFTQPLPGMVFAHVLGLPEADYPRFKAWGEEVLADTYPTLNRTERGEGLHGAHPEFSAYIDGLVEERRHEPRNDLITRMTQPDADGDVLTDTEIRVTVMHLIIAGHETTTNLLGNLLEHMLTTPAISREDARGPVATPRCGRRVTPARPAGADPTQDLRARRSTSTGRRSRRRIGWC